MAFESGYITVRTSAPVLARIALPWGFSFVTTVAVPSVRVSPVVAYEESSDR